MDRHLQEHVTRYQADTGRTPRVLDAPDHAGEDEDIAYPLGKAAWAHVHREGQSMRYRLVEPRLPDDGVERVRTLKQKVAAAAAAMGDKDRDGTLRDGLLQLVARVHPVASDDDPVTYHLLRDMAGLGPIDALLRDPDIEDIHVVGTTDAHVIHRRFGMLRTDVRFADPIELMRFLRILCERVGRPVSDAVPIVDAVLEDGSRLNLVYSEDVSRRGPSLSIRRASERPASITQLVSWGTLTSEAAAYLWLCLEQGMSMFLCGEAACGKTTTLNAILSFIDHGAKIYSAEDTPEVRPPHKIWQRLLTRETGPPESHVRMFDLLKAALRSRPDYIVVGEIRGAEGAVAFQAMQTGHPTVATFHATSPTSLVQRLGAPPISVPLAFMDNLNLALFQETRRVRGRPARRVTSIVEVAGVTPDGIVAIPVFEYDPAQDRLEFKGQNNSHVLENKIATVLGLDDTRAIYARMHERARAIESWVQDGIFDGDQVDARIAEARRRM